MKKKESISEYKYTMTLKIIPKAPNAIILTECNTKSCELIVAGGTQEKWPELN